MKTSAILHRVADFLKGFPPFCYLDTAALEAVAVSGRVRFHERDEILFSAGGACDAHLRVIQQGTVRLTRPGTTQEHVVDLLGAGDMVGLGHFRGRATQEHTASTLSDTVVYALDFKTVARVCAESPQATRFLQVHLTAAEVAASPTDDNDSPAATGTRAVSTSHAENAAAMAGRDFVSCRAGDSMQTAAALMQSRQLEELLVVDAAGHPLGCVTAAGLRACVASGEPPAQARVSGFMLAAPPTVTAATDGRACLLEMLRHDRRQVAVTVDGTPATAATGLVAEEKLLRWQGGNPTVIIRALGQCDRVTDVAALRHRLDRLLQAGLREFQNLDWFAAIVSEANRVMLRKLLELSAAATTAALGPPAPAEFCLALVGEAGRGEVLTPTALEMILILETRAADNDPWFATLAEALAANLAACGFAAPVSGFSPVNVACRMSLDAWSEHFRAWIASPIEHNILERLPLFDVAPVQRDHPLAEKLRATVREALAANRVFIRLLANDCFENLPPLTILQGYAVDAQGLQTEELALQDHATRPVADVARVFQLATGDIAVTSTLERLARAEKSQPEAAAIFEQAARAFRIALACRATVGLKTGTDGARIRPALLARADQLLLKSGFQSIAALLDHAARAHGFRR